jgi:hypothetical protein
VEYGANYLATRTGPEGVDVDSHGMSEDLLEDYDYTDVSNSESKVPAGSKDCRLSTSE